MLWNGEMDGNRNGEWGEIGVQNMTSLYSVIVVVTVLISMGKGVVKGDLKGRGRGGEGKTSALLLPLLLFCKTLQL